MASEAASIFAQVSEQVKAAAELVDTYEATQPVALIDCAAWCYAAVGRLGARTDSVAVGQETAWNGMVRFVANNCEHDESPLPMPGITAPTLGALCAALAGYGVDVWTGWRVC